MRNDNLWNNQILNIDIQSLLWLPGDVFFFWKDCFGHYMGCNDNAAEKVQLASRHDVVGRSDFDLSVLHVDEAKSIRQGDQLVINTQKPQYFLHSATGSESKNIFITMKAPLRNQDNKIVGVYGFDTFIDIHDESSYIPMLTKAGLSIKELIALKSKIQCQNSITAIKTLSRRQTDCLYYLTRGMTIKEIAKALNLSPKTVEHYLETIKQKLNCNTRSELVAKALKAFSQGYSAK